MSQVLSHAVKYIAIVGPTGSGKSSLALELAESIKGELINCDSVQLYRGFNIGAAKHSSADQERVPHHLWDRLEWYEDFDARLYAEEASQLVEQISARDYWPVIVGGTGLYLRALWRENWHDLPKSQELRTSFSTLSTEDIRRRLAELDPERAAALHPNDRFRLQRALEIVTLLGHPLRQLAPQKSERSLAFVIRVCCDRAELHRRIEERTRLMLERGFVEEVQGLLDRGVDPECKAMRSIGYAEVVRYLKGEISSLDALEKAIAIATRQYAKRQETWFNQVQADFCWTKSDDTSQLRHMLINRSVAK